MGRHEIPGKNPSHKVVVGWDPSLATFFGQVIDPTLPEGDRMVHRVGADYPGQLTTLLKLMGAMARYARVPPMTLIQLLKDREMDV